MRNKTLLNKTVIISAGGTGGHVYPALSIAHALTECGAKIEWLGTEQGIESRLVPENGFNLNTIAVKGLRKKGLSSMLKAPFMLMKSIYEAKQLVKKIKKNHEEVVLFVGFGGFASGPGAIAAKMAEIKVVIHEQNAAMGLTNRMVSRWANLVVIAFPSAMQKAFKSKTKLLGNPVRKVLNEIDAPVKRVRQSKPYRILVVGGSLGAKAINEVVPNAVTPLLGEIEVTHQTGKTTYDDTLKAYQRLGVADKVTIKPYIEDMKTAYDQADLFIGRAGALTVSEVATVGIASIFVPLPFAVDDHQTKNAQFLVENKSAEIIEQSALTSSVLNTLIKDNLSSENLLTKAMLSREKSHKDALSNIVEAIIEVINGR